MSLFNDKRGLLPRQWIVLVVIIGMLIFAVSSIIAGWNNKYSQTESAAVSSSFNKINDMAVTSNEMQDKINTATQPQIIGWLDFIVTGGYQVLISVLSVPTVLISFLQDVGGTYDIPTPFISGMMVLITVAAIFGIVASIFRRKT